MANMQLQDRSLLRDKAYVDGRWIAADSGRSFPVDDPADGDEITRVPDLGVAETRRAIEAPTRPIRRGGRRPPRNAPPCCADGTT